MMNKWLPIHYLSIKLTFVLAVVFLNLSCPAGASTKREVSLTKVSEFVSKNGVLRQWLPPIENTGLDNQYFIANTSGELYSLKGDTILSDPVIDLSATLINSTGIKLTAFILNRNFSISDSIGFNSLYTAHTEEFTANTDVDYIEGQSTKITREFDLVVRRWQLALSSDGKYQVLHSEEVIRIASPAREVEITHLSFDRYAKSWLDDYSSLYISLTASKQFESEPLYSGSVLRINPIRSGQQNYSVPTTNPFLNKANINDEIFLLGAQSIQQVFWPDKYNGKLLLKHEYKGQPIFSLSKGGSDWLKNEPDSILVAQKNWQLSDSVILYQGNKHEHLSGKLLFIEQDSNKLQLRSLKLNTRQAQKLNTEHEWLLDDANMLAAGRISLFSASNGDILFFNHDFNTIFTLNDHQQLDINSDAVKSIEFSLLKLFQKLLSKLSLSKILLLLALIAIVYLINIHYWPKKVSTKELLKGKLTSFTLDKAKHTLSLYRFHKRKVDTILSLHNIIRSEVYLNNVEINIISNELGHGFSKIQESDLLNSLAHEHHHKMQVDEVRKVSLHLIDDMQNEYSIYLYMRKGNIRLTRNSYEDVTNELVAWCWLLSGYINPSESVQQNEGIENKEHLSTNM